MQSNTRKHKPEQGHWARRRARPILPRWITAFLLTTSILFTLTPVWAGEIHLQTSGNRIRGFARQARLGEVLGQLAEGTGFKVFVDENLLDSEVSFNLPPSLTAEQAIRRIVHPHSHALVFARIPGSDDVYIQQVKVFSKGGQDARYVVVDGSKGTVGTQASYARGDGPVRSMSPGAASFLSGVAAGPQAVRRHVRPPVEFTTNALGLSGFKYPGQGKGPDYRISSLDMSKAYARYRSERQTLERRSDNSLLQAMHQNQLKNRSRYQDQRTRSIRHSVTRTNP